MNKCRICSLEYEPTRKNQQFCSLKCYYKTRVKTPIVKICINCNKSFEINRRAATRDRKARIYCSQNCAFHNSERNKKISVARIGKFTGVENGKWKGGVSISNGYAVITNGKKRVHRDVMEKFLGRRLLENEIVHHINEDTLDNRIENLQVMSQSEHNTLHKKGKQGWSLGKTKETDERIKNLSEAKVGKPRFNIRGKNHWSYRKKQWQKELQ